MSVLNLKAQLTGTGVVNNSFIFLEKLPTSESPNAIAIGLFPKNSTRKEWNNNNIKIEVDKDLDYQLNVHAFKGTDWTFKLTDRNTSKEILNINNTTGSDLQNGINVSIIKGSIKV